MKTLEMLGIVLFRFNVLPRTWAILLMGINTCSVLFIHTPYGQANFGAVIAAVLVMSTIHARLGFVRLLGIGHIFWVPMLIGFYLHLPDSATNPLLYVWIVTLMGFNGASLVIDAVDVARFIGGERQPHYRWELPDGSLIDEDKTFISPDAMPRARHHILCQRECRSHAWRDLA